MSWKEHYDSHKMSVKEAVNLIKSRYSAGKKGMLWTGQYSLVSDEALDCIVEYDASIIECAPPKIVDIEKTIDGKNHLAKALSGYRNS